MSNSVSAADPPSNLRQRAVARLTFGTRTDLRRTSTSAAMGVLHQLASSPETAGDALALLHELQVHQVELDLQQEDLRQTLVELESALMRQTELFERAPVAYLTLDAATVVLEINLAGARLLGAERDELLGRPFTGFLTAAGVGQLQGLHARARDGLAPETGALQLLPAAAGVVRTLHAVVDRDTAPGRYLLVLMAPAMAEAPGDGSPPGSTGVCSR